MPSTLTPAEVETLTGVAVSTGDLAVSRTVVEVHAGRNQDVWPYLKASDQRSLKLAVAFQAAWFTSHPEALGSMDVASISQLDQSITPRDAEALTLAPLARRMLKRLSWRGIRAVPIVTDFQRTHVDTDHAGYWGAL